MRDVLSAVLGVAAVIARRASRPAARARMGVAAGALLTVAGIDREVDLGVALIVAGVALIAGCLFLVDTGEGKAP